MTLTSYAPATPLEPLYTVVHLACNIPARQATLEVHLEVVAHVTCASLFLDGVALHNLTVHSLDNHALLYQYDGKQIQIVWKEPVQPTQHRKFKVCYNVIDPLTGLVFSHPDEFYPKRPCFAGESVQFLVQCGVY